MSHFDGLFQRLSQARLALDAAEGDWETRDRADARLHSILAEIAASRQVR